MRLPDVMLTWRSSAATRRGQKRAVNEDSFGQDDEAGVFIVADGVGGHADGEVASRAVIETLSAVADLETDLGARASVLEEGLRSVNAALWRHSLRRPDGRICASTAAALLLAEGYAVCLWAGDSRIYVSRGGHLYQLSRDHIVDSGPEAHRGSLTRAVGADEELEVDRLVTAAQSGDTFLVCSDGVSKVVDDEEVARLLEGPIELLADRIIAAVAERDGNDDATAIVVRYMGA
ncbi:MAG: serine/threonine-protein phosphatase [Hyphomicrobiales bacterium]|nr:serine/threonine-protein phosphatase [Hyphomicrobiales bacterium]MBV8664198.1 serine/threonine-protein phosphatase [Hyphomicrobiales bacterium]